MPNYKHTNIFNSNNDNKNRYHVELLLVIL